MECGWLPCRYTQFDCWAPFTRGIMDTENYGKEFCTHNPTKWIGLRNVFNCILETWILNQLLIWKWHNHIRGCIYKSKSKNYTFQTKVTSAWLDISNDVAHDSLTQIGSCSLCAHLKVFLINLCEETYKRFKLWTTLGLSLKYLIGATNAQHPHMKI